MLEYANFGRRPVFSLQLPCLFVVVWVFADLFSLSFEKIQQIGDLSKCFHGMSVL